MLVSKKGYVESASNNKLKLSQKHTSYRCNTTVWSIPADPTTQLNVPVRQWDQNVFKIARKVLILKSLSLIFMLWEVMYGWLSEALVGGEILSSRKGVGTRRVAEREVRC